MVRSNCCCRAHNVPTKVASLAAQVKGRQLEFKVPSKSLHHIFDGIKEEDSKVYGMLAGVSQVDLHLAGSQTQ